MRNPNKTISANSQGIIIYFQDVKKHKFLPYENKAVKDIQSGKTQYQTLEATVFNPIQQKLYAETVYGLASFRKQELEAMSQSSKDRIMVQFSKAQMVLNQWKQEIVYETVDKFLAALFPHSPVVKDMTSVRGTTREIKETHSFKELGLDQVTIAKKLIKAHILPENFFELA